MRPITPTLSLAFAASLLCTACVGNVAGPAEEKKQSKDQEYVSDVKADANGAAKTAAVLAKRGAR